jgi:Xaa-Pro aminopeptidase
MRVSDTSRDLLRRWKQVRLHSPRFLEPCWPCRGSAPCYGLHPGSVLSEVFCEAIASYTFEVPPHPMGDLSQKIIERLQPLPKSVVGVEGDHLPFSLLERIRNECGQLEFQDIAQTVAELRMVKDQEEIQAIQEAVGLCDLGQEQAMRLAEPGITELELFEEVRKAMETKAAGRVPLLCDFVSGPRTAQVGGPATSRVLGRGDLVLVDLAPQYQGYWGDSCNTFSVAEPTREQQTLFKGIAEALAEAIEFMRPEVRACDVDALLRERMGQLGGSYPHHSGHGLGVTYHEEPRIVPYNQFPLRENMVIALEPGVYFKDRWGLRLEYVVLVTARGSLILSGFRHALA